MDFESPTLSQRSGSPPSLTLSLTGLALAGLGGGWRLGPRAGLALAGLGGRHGAAVILRCGALALLCTSSFIYFISTVLQCYATVARGTWCTGPGLSVSLSRLTPVHWCGPACCTRRGMAGGHDHSLLSCGSAAVALVVCVLLGCLP